jgi:hypothetical protein
MFISHSSITGFHEFKLRWPMFWDGGRLFNFANENWKYRVCDEVCVSQWRRVFRGTWVKLTRLEEIICATSHLTLGSIIPARGWLNVCGGNNRHDALRLMVEFSLSNRLPVAFDLLSATYVQACLTSRLWSMFERVWRAIASCWFHVGQLFSFYSIWLCEVYKRSFYKALSFAQKMREGEKW